MRLIITLEDPAFLTSRLPFVFTKTGLNGPRQGGECDPESARREQEFAYPETIPRRAVARQCGNKDGDADAALFGAIVWCS